MKKVLLISMKVMHYRASLYNYFFREFQKIGWDFIVRADELEKQNPHSLEFDFKEIPLPFSNYRKEILALNPDVVILFLYLKTFFTWPLVHWLKLKQIPFIYWNKGINLEVPNPFIRNQLFYYIHTLSDGIILYSQNEMDHIKSKNRHKTSVANNTINFTDFPDIIETKEEIKRDFGIPFRKVVLFVGRMRGLKRVDHLVEVFHSIDRSDVGLVIVGDDLGQNISKKINKANTIFLGEIFDPHHTSISRLFKMADLFCIPGDVGLGLNQAFYWGLPVVTEDIPFKSPEIYYLRNGINGYIVPDNDLTALRNKIMLLLNDDELRKEFSNNARQEILRNASPHNMFLGFRRCVEYVHNASTRNR
jgi:glycosyltransferase involved in cell wall biosynthesis